MSRRYSATRGDINMRPVPLLLLLLLVATLATVTRSALVGDYASNLGCGETVVEALCDLGQATANRACSDACHYKGCGGGRCVYLGTARGCHCLP